MLAGRLPAVKQLGVSGSRPEHVLNGAGAAGTLHVAAVEGLLPGVLLGQLVKLAVPVGQDGHRPGPDENADDVLAESDQDVAVADLLARLRGVVGGRGSRK